MNNEQLIFVDPGYLPDIGHYQNYASALRQAVEARGIHFSHYVNMAVPEAHAKTLKLERWFPCRATMSDAAFSDKNRSRFFIDSFAARLTTILRKHFRTAVASGPITLFMYTGHPRLLTAIAEVMNAEEFKCRDIRFQFNLFYVSNAFALKTGDEGHARLLADISDALENSDPTGRVRLFADSSRIINIYGRHFRRPMTLLPIPLGFHVSNIGTQGPPDRMIRLGYLGYTQPKQGYPYIRRLYHDILANPDQDKVVLKVRHNVFNIDASMSVDLRDLVGSHERIENIVNYQSPEEYDAFLRDCDIVLLPYQRTAYPLQTSGMLIDALCRGKPVVVPENTWLSDQLQQHGAGITFSGIDYASFKKAVDQAITTLPVLRKNACRNLSAFATFHSPDSLVDTLFNEFTDESPTSACTHYSSDGDCMELLSLEILERDPSITELVYGEKIARRKNLGWHYILDLAWIAGKLKKLPRGSLILDAGAGDGLLQYVLLKMGFRVISVDFIVRNGPRDVNWISVSTGETFDNDYVQHLKQNYSATDKADNNERVVQTTTEFRSLIGDEDAELVYYRSDVSNMALLSDEMVDAVVSVSALEHNTFEITEKAVRECLRVLKPGGPMVTTTSAAMAEDWYHQPSKGWCYSEATLQRLFQLDTSAESNYSSYAEVMDQLKQPGNELQVQLAPFYFASGNNGMPWGHWSPEYLPVGTCKIKAKR